METNHIELPDLLPKANDFESKIDNKEIGVFILKNNGVYAAITNYGGRIVSLLVPDKNNNLIDVIIGPGSLKQFVSSTEPYFGATIGRYGNRIANGKFELDEFEYNLPKNEGGKTTLHGGIKGFQHVVWTPDQINDTTLKLNYLSKDGEEGFPGNLEVEVKFSLTNDKELHIEYQATTDKKTIVNLTNHAFFNLNGQGGVQILEDFIQINADNYTPINEDLIPLGEIKPVDHSVFDFRHQTQIGARIEDKNEEQLSYGQGYDHNFVLNKVSDWKKEPAVRVYSSHSGIKMEIFTQEPCLLFYSGNFMRSTNTLKGNTKDLYRTAIVLEPHQYPDSPNQKNFPKSILEPNEAFSTKTIYKFLIGD